MPTFFSYISDNSAQLIAAVMAGLVLAEMVVRMTKTTKDDVIVGRIKDFLAKKIKKDS